MGKWERVTVEDPIFTKGPKRGRGLVVDGEWMALKRYISPTEIWVQRPSMFGKWMLSMEDRDRATPFVTYLKGD